MTLFKTDWTHELDQAKLALSEVIDEKVEPLIDRSLDRSAKEISVAMDKASFEIQDAIKQFSAEMERQKNDFLKKLTYLVFVVFGFVFAFFAIGFSSLIS